MSLDELIDLGGSRVREHAPIGPSTTYRVGGSARVLVSLEGPEDLEALSGALAGCALPLVALGNGSNLLVNEGEHQIVAVRLGTGFATLAIEPHRDHVTVVVGAALDLPVAARRLSGAGVAGFEWAVGVPGTLGGAVAMNAGGHGSDMAASVTSARVWRAGRVLELDASDLDFGYRTSRVQPGDLVLDATLRLREGDPEASRQRVREIVAWRRENQPGGANAGSVFRNPPGDSAGRLIESLGLKGSRVGSAAVSDKHANFIQVDEGGRAGDVYALARDLARRVREATGVELVFEHRLIGFEGTA